VNDPEITRAYLLYDIRLAAEQVLEARELLERRQQALARAVDAVPNLSIHELEMIPS